MATSRSLCPAVAFVALCVAQGACNAAPKPTDLYQRVVSMDACLLRTDLTQPLPQAEVLAQADAMLNAHQYVLVAGAAPVTLAPPLNWDFQHPTSPSSYQLYLQNMAALRIFADAYAATHQATYLQAGRSHLLSWMAYARSNPKNRMVWYDHAVAFRTLNILYFLSKAQASPRSQPLLSDTERRDVQEMLLSHGAHMADDSHYYFNHNHGVMTDMALYELALVTANEAWRQHARTRVRAQYDYLFDVSGVSRENSIDYHIDNTALFDHLAALATCAEPSSRWASFIEVNAMYDYIAVAIAPTGSSPANGDSDRKRLRYWRDRILISTDQLLRQKRYQNKLYRDSGTSFLQHKRGDGAGWAMLIAGYSSPTHKQTDDLHVSLSTEVDDIFVDAGRYNYEWDDPHRQYVASKRAHNAVDIAACSYQPKNPDNQLFVGLLSLTSAATYDRTAALQQNCDHATILRNLLRVGDGIYVVADEIEQYGSAAAITQRFNLSPQLKASKAGPATLALASTTRAYAFGVAAADGRAFALSLSQGSESSPPFIAPSFNEATPIAQAAIEFGGAPHTRSAVYLATGGESVLSMTFTETGLDVSTSQQTYQLPLERIADHLPWRQTMTRVNDDCVTFALALREGEPQAPPHVSWKVKKELYGYVASSGQPIYQKHISLADAAGDTTFTYCHQALDAATTYVTYDVAGAHPQRGVFPGIVFDKSRFAVNQTKTAQGYQLDVIFDKDLSGAWSCAWYTYRNREVVDKHPYGSSCSLTLPNPDGAIDAVGLYIKGNGNTDPDAYRYLELTP